jgi:hypothetical protein
MARPRKTTLDEWLDKFAEWDAEDRVGALQQAADAHKWLSVAERRKCPSSNETGLPLLDCQSQTRPSGGNGAEHVGGSASVPSAVGTDTASIASGTPNRNEDSSGGSGPRRAQIPGNA